MIKIIFMILSLAATFLILVWASTNGNIGLALVVSGIAWVAFIAWIVRIDPPENS